MDGIMQDDKKAKKDIIEKLRMILDNPHINDESIKNKDLLQLRKKLVEPSAINIISSRKIVEEKKDDDPLKPSVTIHREQKLSTSEDTFIEVKEEEEETEKVIFEEVEEDLFKDEDLYEFEKIEDNIEEFAEIKDEDETVEEVKKDEIFDDEEVESLDDLPEWETVETEVVKSNAKDVEKESMENIPEWEPITNEQFKDKIPKIKETKIKKDEDKKISDFESDKSDYDYFVDIDSIDDNIAKLLVDHGYKSIEDLRDITIKELTKIKGIKRKTAKKIKSEINNYYKNNTPEFESIEDELSDEDFEKNDFSDEKVDESNIIHRKDGKFSYGDYTLYRKEITLQSDKKRVIHFFSKDKPDDGEVVDLPKGYDVKVNKKTGVPYISKKK